MTLIPHRLEHFNSLSFASPITLPTPSLEKQQPIEMWSYPNLCGENRFWNEVIVVFAYLVRTLNWAWLQAGLVPAYRCSTPLLLPRVSSTTAGSGGSGDWVGDGFQPPVLWHAWSAWGSRSGTVPMGFELLDCCDIWGFVGEKSVSRQPFWSGRCWLKASGAADFSTLSQSSRPSPCSLPCACGLSSGGGSGRARARLGGGDDLEKFLPLLSGLFVYQRLIVPVGSPPPPQRRQRENARESRIVMCHVA